VWSLTEKECKQKLTDHQSSVYCISCLEPDQSDLKEALVASGSSDQTIGIWSLTDPSYSRILHGHVAPIKDVVFAPNGRFLASIDTSGFLLVWCTQVFFTFNDAHKQSVDSWFFPFRPGKQSSAATPVEISLVTGSCGIPLPTNLQSHN
jgi:WD40 repeat protein